MQLGNIRGQCCTTTSSTMVNGQAVALKFPVLISRTLERASLGRSSEKVTFTTRIVDLRRALSFNWVGNLNRLGTTSWPILVVLVLHCGTQIYVGAENQYFYFDSLSTEYTLLFKLLGLTISFVQLGVAAAQGFCYYQAFPDDKRLLKYLVLTVLILNTTGALLTSFTYWSFFTNCFQSMSPECRACCRDVVAMIQIFVNITLSFIVQSFYCHRVWITLHAVSDKNIYITIPIDSWIHIGEQQILFAVSSYVTIPPQEIGAFSSITPLKMSTAKAFQSVLCDSLISFSVYFYLRAGRFGVHRTDTRIKTITKNFISMGILYWANASVAIGGIAMVLRSCETTSRSSTLAHGTIARLNARKLRLQTMENDIELATISAVHNSR
ncbi:hypothetical protein BDR04DRAFT_1115398 [Suillus decipiens]|nr:hypothetical protein BDR04DRAFT_1115398 [Suillus decipiens]